MAVSDYRTKSPGAELIAAERVRIDRDREVIEARIVELQDQYERAERAVETGAVSANETAQLRLQRDHGCCG